MRPSDKAIAATILDLAARRGAGGTLCTSEAARALAQDWRPLMPEVRRVAGTLAAQGRLVVMKKGRPVEADTASGPIRLGLPRG